MDNFFLNRMNSQQRIVKKKQETIFEISIGFLHCFKILLKLRFRYSLVFSNDPYATLPARALRGRRVKQHPILKKIIHSAIFKDLGEKLPDPSNN
jgi:hypothetical protein